MNRSKKQRLLKFLVIVFNLAIAAVFVFSLIIMTTDAQGIFVFVITLPIIMFLSIASIFASKKIELKNNYFLKFSKAIIIGLCSFSVSGLIPMLNRIPSRSIDFLIQSFTLATGKTPRQYFKDRNNLQKLIEAELLTTNGAKIDVSKMNTANHWIRFCIFTPYTSDLVADQVAGVNFKLSQYSDVSSNDGIHVIALFDENSLANYVNLKRSVIDFEFTESICVSRSEAILHKQLNSKFKF